MKTPKMKYSRAILTGVFISACLLYIPAIAEESLVILYTGSTLGEIKPCGCSEEGDMGGILRRAAIVEKEREKNKNLILLDAGDNFKEPTEQGKLKAAAIIESLSKMNYDAAIFGEKDFIYGEEVINNGSFNRWVLSNLENKKLDNNKVFKYLIKELNDGTRIAVIGLLSKNLLSEQGQRKIEIEDSFSALEQIIKKLKLDGSVDIILLLAHMEKSKAEKLLDYKDVDIVINGHLTENERVVEPIILNNKIVAHTRERGQYLGKISLTIDQGRIQNISNEYIPLTPEIIDSKIMVSLYNEYEEGSKRIFMKWLKDKKKIKDSPFANVTTCRECHEKEYIIWENSKHAHAFSSIKKADKTFDPECLLCHTTGFKVKGGFLEESITPKLTNVQCEVCHGAAVAHIKDQSKLYGEAPNEETCLKCHTKENSPAFDYSTYWQKIRH